MHIVHAGKAANEAQNRAENHHGVSRHRRLRRRMRVTHGTHWGRAYDPRRFAYIVITCEPSGNSSDRLLRSFGANT